MESSIRIREATLHDRDFLLSLIPRLVEFGPPAWRDADYMVKFDQEVLAKKLEEASAGTLILMAEDSEGTPLGFLHLQLGHDYYYKEKHAHIEDLIMTPEGEGRGITSRLISEAENWARQKGFKWITLNVFSQNHKARSIYDHLGYGEDIIKYVKVL